jgi:hypothetical protein
MITTEKNWLHYKGICDCGKEVVFASNQKPGALEYFMCECFAVNSGTLNPSGKSKNARKF